MGKAHGPALSDENSEFYELPLFGEWFFCAFHFSFR
jgi:hypothetical protein